MKNYEIIGKPMTIGSRIKQLRNERGLTQSDLAERLGKSLRTIQKYENDEIEFTISTADEIAEALDTTSEYIFFGILDDEVSDELCADILNYLLKHALEVGKIPAELRKAIDDYDKQKEQSCKCEMYHTRFESIRYIADGYIEYEPFKLSKRFNCSPDDVRLAVSDMMQHDMVGYVITLYHRFINADELITKKYLGKNSRTLVRKEDIEKLRYWNRYKTDNNSPMANEKE